MIKMSSTKKRITIAYDSVASLYDVKANQSFYEKEKAILSKFLKNNNRRNVLDIGGGTCRFYDVLAGEEEYIALDISRKMLEIGRRTHPIEAIVADAEHLPIIPGRFDLVVMLEILQFLPKPDLTFREIRRIMGGSGVAIVTIPNVFWSIPVKIMLLLGLTYWPGYSKETRTVEQYEHAILDADMEIQETDGFKMLPLFPIVSKLVKLRRSLER